MKIAIISVFAILVLWGNSLRAADEAALAALQSADEQRVAATVDWMRDHLYCSARLPELAMRARMSIPHYSALFRQITGYAPVNYHLRLRILRACHFLDTTDLPISEIAREVGFEDPYYFSRIFRRIMGRAPRNYRHQQKG